MKVHYFQRYHGKENVATANTMLLFSRIYHNSPSEFYELISHMFATTQLGNIDMEPAFDLQVKSAVTVPDAVLSQPNFKVVMETKLYSNFDINQLKGHLEEFKGEDVQVLLTLDPCRLNKSTANLIEREVAAYNRVHASGSKRVYHLHLTFEEAYEHAQHVIDDRDRLMMDMVADYADFCREEGLISDEERTLRAVSVGETQEENLNLRLYYMSETRSYRPYAYLGLYSNKAITHVGKLIKSAVAYYDGGKLVCREDPGCAPCDSDELRRIEKAINLGIKKCGYDGLDITPYRYFFVDEFEPTNFVKTSPYGLLSTRYFDLEDYAPLLFADGLTPPAIDVAKSLDGKEWE